MSNLPTPSVQAASATATRLARLKYRATYAAWRRQIPYTDDHILTALKEIAANLQTRGKSMQRAGFPEDVVTWFARERHLTQALHVFVLPFLVKQCALCGRTAHYRYGSEGRCRAHKMLPTEGADWNIQRHQRRQQCVGNHLDRVDQEARRRERSRRRARGMKHGAVA